jgi:hypothetical protein
MGDVVITDQVQSTKLAGNQSSENPQWRVVDLMACSVCALADTSCSPGKMVNLLVAVWSLSESVSDESAFHFLSQASGGGLKHLSDCQSYASLQ